MANEEMIYEVAGFPGSRIGVDVGYITRCGDIEDGVAFRHVGAPGYASGGWVIAFKDIEDLYLKAKATRDATVSPS